MLMFVIDIELGLTDKSKRISAAVRVAVQRTLFSSEDFVQFLLIRSRGAPADSCASIGCRAPL